MSDPLSIPAQHDTDKAIAEIRYALYHIIQAEMAATDDGKFKHLNEAKCAIRKGLESGE